MGQEGPVSVSLLFLLSPPNPRERQNQQQRSFDYLVSSQEKVTDGFADVTAAVFFT